MKSCSAKELASQTPINYQKLKLKTKPLVEFSQNTRGGIHLQ